MAGSFLKLVDVAKKNNSSRSIFILPDDGIWPIYFWMEDCLDLQKDFINEKTSENNEVKFKLKYKKEN